MKIVLKAPKAPEGRIEVENGDGISGDFLHTGQHPFCKQISPTICTTSNKLWVVVEATK